MSEQDEFTKRMLGLIPEKPSPEPSKPEIETEGVFDQSLLDSAGFPFPGLDPEAFMDNPMLALLKPLIQYFESIKPPMAFTTPPKTEHKVRVFRFTDRTLPGVVEAEMQELFDEGYCCHMPTVVNNFVIMDFSRRKETEENGEQ